MKRSTRLLLVLSWLAVMGSAPARAQRDSTEASIPEPVGFVNDQAGLMDEASRAKLEAFLDQVKRKTGAEFAVLTVKSSAPLDPSEYKVKVFEKWRLGKAGEDNGLLLLVDIAARRAEFETGYGLEGILPDGLEARIVRQEMVPKFQAGDFTGGIIAGVLRAAQVISRDKGVTLEWNGETLRYDDAPSSRSFPGWVIALMVVFLILAMRAGGGGRRRRGPWWLGPGGFGGYGGGWGGGFGGGGFGGGGGGSFGGFGGGGSGGGGGGGSW